MKKRVLSIIIAVCLTICLTPTTAFAETLPNNPVGDTIDTLDAEDLIDINHGTVTTNNGEINHNYGTVATHNGVMSYNYGVVATNKSQVLDNKENGVVTTNKASVSNNYGMVTTNDGEIPNNWGTVKTNKNTIRSNFGTVTVNNGIIENNLCGIIKTNNGEIINDYKYKIDFSEAINVCFYSGDENDDSLVYTLSDEAYIKPNATVIIDTNQGYKFTKNSAPKIIGSSGELTDNGDGTYTLTNVKSDIKVTASPTFVPVKDIKQIKSTAYAGQVFELNDSVEIKPKKALNILLWEIIDAGTTGAKVESPEAPGLVTLYSEGTLKVKATIENGIAEGQHFTKVFTITVTNIVPEVYEAYKKVQTALLNKDIDELKAAKNSFEPLLDIYNDLSERQLEMLGEMLGDELAANEVFSIVFNDWINVNVILQLNTNVEDYKANPNKTTAKAFVDYYDTILESPEYEDAQALILEFIPDIDDSYQAALATLNGNTTSQAGGLSEAKPERQPEEKPVLKPNTQATSPKTNDVSSMGLAMLFMITALSAVIALKASRKAFNK